MEFEDELDTELGLTELDEESEDPVELEFVELETLEILEVEL